MKKLFAIVLACLIMAPGAYAIKLTNGRKVPEATDLRPLGHAADMIEDLLTETANALGSTVDGDDLEVDAITTSGLATLEYMKYGNVVSNTSGADTVTAAETGSIFVATKSDGATTFTLPAPSASTVGVVYRFVQTADQNLVVIGATADNNAIVADGVATTDQVSCATSSHKIGSGVLVIGISATKWAAFAMNSECPLTVEAAD